jgi:hypothetical protein
VGGRLFLRDDWRPSCPECGEPLFIETIQDKKTRELKVSIVCAGDASDEFEFEISTRLKEEDLSDLEKGKRIAMEGTLLKRESDPELAEEDR